MRIDMVESNFIKFSPAALSDRWYSLSIMIITKIFAIYKLKFFAYGAFRHSKHAISIKNLGINL